MRALDRKLLRDLWRLRYQAVTIAILVGCGIASYVAAVTTSVSLQWSRDVFYRQSHFGDIFARLIRAPRSVLDRIADLPGVAGVEGRVIGDYRVEMDFSTEPVAARFVSLEWPQEEKLNQIRILAGRQVEPGSASEVVVSDMFSRAWNLAPGSSLSAVIDGQQLKLQVVGIGVSPEFVFPLSPQTGLPDPLHFGVVWLDGDALRQTTGLVGAFNDVSVQLGAGADLRQTMSRIDRLLDPYGGLGAIARADQPSAKLVDQKINQLARLAVTLPLVFVGVAVFLLNLLLGRIVGSQREQIATLKALGYRTAELERHYLTLAGAICALGVLVGVGLGLTGARALLSVYEHYLEFPAFSFRVDAGSVLAGTLAAFAGAIGGTLRAVRRAVSIPPAEAMRPEAPRAYRQTRIERLFRPLSAAARMVLRDALRRRVRLLLSSASIALATAIVVAGGVLKDSIAETLRLQFEVAHREDIRVTLKEARPWRAVRDLAHIPGVRLAEGERVVPVRLRAGSRERTTVIEGLRPGADLHRILVAHERLLALQGGLSLSRPLGKSLGVKEGDAIDMEILEGRRSTMRVRVAALVDDLLGLSGYMSAAELASLLAEAQLANTVLMEVEHRDLDEVAWRLNALPEVASLSRPDLDRSLVQSEVADEFTVLEVMLAIFAAAIAVGVVYNNARIALEVRSRDLATLRILGFSRGELAVVLLGEQSIQLFLGIVPGLWLGRALGALSLSSVDQELIRVPATLKPPSLVAAACVILFAALVSALLVRRRSDRLDLVAVLKARD